MTTSGQAIFFDGATSARHEVTVELLPATLQVRSTEGTVLADWPYDEIEALSAPEDLLRIGRRGSPVLARVEVRDPQLAQAIDALSVPIDRSGKIERRGRRKVVFWSIAATVSLLLMAIFGVPAIASRLTPLVPYAAEQRLGAVVDGQVRTILDSKHAGARFECGNDEAERPARAVFGKLFAKLDQAAGLPISPRIAVLRKSDANAVALPGGLIYVFYGLIEKSENPDELAGVIAHELGHVAHRDGTRSVLQNAGTSFLIGMLLGDFVGGGAVVVAARTILQSSYSRNVEAAADGYAVDLMHKIEGDPRALGTILMRIAGSTHEGMKLLLDHPDTKDRVAAINAMARGGTSKPLLDGADWTELKRICQGS